MPKQSSKVFRQCMFCSVFLLSENATRKHFCYEKLRYSTKFLPRRNMLITTTVGVKFPHARIKITRLSRDKCSIPQNQGASSLIKPDSTPAKASQFSSRKLRSDERSTVHKNVNRSERKWRSGGMQGLLKSLGVNDLKEVEAITSTPRRCRLAASQKLQNVCDQLGSHKADDNPEVDEDDQDFIPPSHANSAELRKIGRPRIRPPKKKGARAALLEDISSGKFWRNPLRKSEILTHCDICSKVVPRSALAKHREAHSRKIERDTSKPFQCPICSVGVKERTNFRRHFVIHLENNPFQCTFPGCGHKCHDDGHLQKHIRRHYDMLTETCPKCGVSFRRYMNKFQHHKCVKDSSKIVIGPDGRKYLKNARARLKRAENIIDKSLVVKKEVPPQELKSVHIVDKIIETDSGPIHVKGEQLPEILEESDKVNEDPRRVEPKRENSNPLPMGQNDILQLILNDPVYLRLIRERPEVQTMILGGGPYNPSSKKFSCTNCGATFARYWTLTLHQKVCRGGSSKTELQPPPSTDQKFNLMCGECGFQTQSQSDLDIHFRVTPNHHLYSSYRCSYPKCGLPFQTEAKLQTHIYRIHVAERKYKCLECGKAFATKAVLQFHLYRVHKKQQATFSCRKCQATFGTWNLLNLHKRKECKFFRKRGEDRSTCEICGDTFSASSSLKRHLRLVHTKTLKIKNMKIKTIGKDGVNRVAKVQMLESGNPATTHQSRLQEDMVKCEVNASYDMEEDPGQVILGI